MQVCHFPFNVTLRPIIKTKILISAGLNFRLSLRQEKSDPYSLTWTVRWLVLISGVIFVRTESAGKMFGWICCKWQNKISLLNMCLRSFYTHKLSIFVCAVFEDSLASRDTGEGQGQVLGHWGDTDTHTHIEVKHETDTHWWICRSQYLWLQGTFSIFFRTRERERQRGWIMLRKLFNIHSLWTHLALKNWTRNFAVVEYLVGAPG